jgi:glutamate formiminotransferase / formiminotetrahydrofolate cyclodeaminase
MKLVECVPNFSEGRDQGVIKAITDEIERVAGARLLDVDPGADTNRTVVTFVGPPEVVAEAAFRAIRKAAELIDMAKHKGAHPRMGATDVCPFVPVSGVTMEDCADLARAVGKRVGDELGVPVYLYEEAASRPERKNLAAIRTGEYEGLADKLKDPTWAPDFGAPVFNPRAGATVIGAREFLIAYNVNLNTRDAKLATEIGSTIRESGKARRDDKGAIVLDEKGQKVMVPGALKGVKATGWYIAQYEQAQVTMNITSYRLAPFHVCFEEVVKEATRLGLRVTGSELVGLIPKEAMLQAGRFYYERQGKSPGQPEDELVKMAIRSMGLDQLGAFDPRKKIIEYRVAEERPLIARSVTSFVDELSTDSATPGGGSVAALSGALGAGLAAMVGNLTVGKKGYGEVADEMRRLGVEGQALKDEMLRAVDDVARSFDAVMAAMRLPKASEADKAARDAAVQEAYLGAIAVPLRVLRGAIRVIEIAQVMAERGFKASLSDAGVGALTGRAAAEGAYYNVAINLGSITDPARKAELQRTADQLLDKAISLAAEVAALVRKRLAPPA